MSVARKVARNTFFLLIADIISKISLFAIAIMIARKLGDVEFGKYSFALAFAFFFVVFSEWGMGMVITREIAKDKKNTSLYINNALSIKCVLTLLSFITMAAFVNIFNYSSDTKMIVYVLGFSSLLFSISNLIRNVFMAYEEMRYDATLTIIEKLLLLTSILIIIFNDYGLLEISISYLIISIISIILSALIMKIKFVSLRLWFDVTTWKKIIKESLPIMLCSIFGVIVLKTDIIMLSFFRGDAVVGWYGASYQIVEGLMFISIIFMTAVFPLMSRFSTTTEKSLLKTSIEKSFKYLIIAILPISIGTILLAKRFIILFYDNQFINSVPSLMILMVMLIFTFGLRPLGYTFLSTNKQNLYFYISAIAATLNILLNLYFIPWLGHVGAAITSLISAVSFFLMTYIYIIKKFKGIKLLRNTLKPLVAAIVMGIFVYNFSTINLILLILTSAIIYATGIIILSALKQDDIRMIKEIIGK